MKYLVTFFFLLTSISASAQDVACEDDSAKVSKALCLFSDPMIVGASVSFGYRANAGGPGALMSHLLNPAAKINRDFAKSGSKSTESLVNHKVPTPVPSVVIGLDLFFWDAAQGACDAKVLDHGKAFIEEYRKLGVPMILGKLPVDVPFPKGYAMLASKDCTPVLNRFLNDQCTLANNCLLYDPKTCFLKLDKEAETKFGVGESERKSAWLNQKRVEFFADSLHPTEAGNLYCASEFVARADYQKLNCK